jgi:hypothetical protein
LHPALAAIRRALAAANPDSRSVAMAAAISVARVSRTSRPFHSEVERSF